MTGATRVLVVEDDLAIARTIQRQLKRYTLSVAHSATEGLAMFETEAPDLVLLDYQLPDGTGGDVVKELRRRRDFVPIILMSGAFDLQRSAEAMAFGADDFIAKPFTREPIEAKIDRLLADFAMRREIASQEAELRRLQERRELEAATARSVLDRMLARGDYDPRWIRHEVIPSDMFAGDAVFASDLGDGCFRWMVGDVTGHTLASALVTIPLSMMFYATASKHVPIPEVLDTMERELARMLPTHMFCAAAIAECDRRTGRLRLWNGGLPDLVLRRANGVLDRLRSHAAPLAADRFHPTHEVLEVEVAPGDRIFAVSDGVIEARDFDGNVLGLEALIEAIAAGPPETAFERMHTRWRNHVTCSEDDASFVEVIV